MAWLMISTILALKCLKLLLKNTLNASRALCPNHPGCPMRCGSISQRMKIAKKQSLIYSIRCLIFIDRFRYGQKYESQGGGQGLREEYIVVDDQLLRRRDGLLDGNRRLQSDLPHGDVPRGLVCGGRLRKLIAVEYVFDSLLGERLNESEGINGLKKAAPFTAKRSKRCRITF